MDADDKDQELVDQAFIYLTCFKYSSDCPENRESFKRKPRGLFRRMGNFLQAKSKSKGIIVLSYKSVVSRRGIQSYHFFNEYALTC